MNTEEYPRDHAFWNPLFILFFLVLGGGVYFLFSRESWFLNELYALNFFSLIILGLATFRVIRLMTYDKITQFLREPFLNKVEGGYQKPAVGFRRAVAELFECVWCTGAWAAVCVYSAYLFAPWGVFAVYILAISALGTVFQNFSQMIVRVAADPHN